MIDELLNETFHEINRFFSSQSAVPSFFWFYFGSILILL